MYFSFQIPCELFCRLLVFELNQVGFRTVCLYCKVTILARQIHSNQQHAQPYKNLKIHPVSTFCFYLLCRDCHPVNFIAPNSLQLLSYDITISQISLMGSIVRVPFVIKNFMELLSDYVNIFALGHHTPYIIFYGVS
jgi:hypothetical protein